VEVTSTPQFHFRTVSSLSNPFMCIDGAGLPVNCHRIIPHRFVTQGENAIRQNSACKISSPATFARCPPLAESASNSGEPGGPKRLPNSDPRVPRSRPGDRVISAGTAPEVALDSVPAHEAVAANGLVKVRSSGLGPVSLQRDCHPSKSGTHSPEETGSSWRQDPVANIGAASTAPTSSSIASCFTTSGPVDGCYNSSRS
jgi:hypothetical protein